MEICNISGFDGVKTYTPDVFCDERGYLKEIYNKKKDYPFIPLQENISFSKKGVLRGLHFQSYKPQAKLVTVLVGKVIDVIVDLRKDSSSFGKSVSFILSDENHIQLFVPRGFAHGFLSLEDTVFKYQCDQFRYVEYEKSILWSDLALGIDWNYLEDDFIVSEKDQHGRLFSSFSDKELF